MKSTLLDFLAGIDQLKAFIARTEQEAELIGLLSAREHELPKGEAELLKGVISSTTSSRQYTYIVAIVSLYGLLERYVVAAINDYIGFASQISGSFDQLPDKIKANHLQLSLRYTEGLLKEKFRTELSWEQVIKNLYSCLPGGAASFQLNAQAFSYHRGNINFGRLKELLDGVGVIAHPRKIANTRPFQSFLATLDPDRLVADLSDHELGPLFEQLDDLVERRNAVSHGAFQVDSIESNDLLLERCKFVEAFVRSIHEILLYALARLERARGLAPAFGKPIKVFKDDVVGLNVLGKLAVGDRIFALGEDEFETPAFGVVLSLEIDNSPHERVETTAMTAVGVRLDFSPPRRRDYFRSAIDLW